MRCLARLNLNLAIGCGRGPIRNLVREVKDHILALCEPLQDLDFDFIPVADFDFPCSCAAVLNDKRTPSLASARRRKGKNDP